jgi:hypothetical protein
MSAAAFLAPAALSSLNLRRSSPISVRAIVSYLCESLTWM